MMAAPDASKHELMRQHAFYIHNNFQRDLSSLRCHSFGLALRTGGRLCRALTGPQQVDLLLERLGGLGFSRFEILCDGEMREVNK